MFSVIVTAMAAFLFLFILQIFIARFYKPKSEDRHVFLLFTILPAVFFLVFLGFQIFTGADVENALLTYLLFFVVSSSWVASFPAVYAASPTLVMIVMISKSRKGATVDELRNLMALTANSTDRIGDAVDSGLLKRNADRVQLTSTGWVVGFFFKTYRQLLGLRLETL